MTFDPVTTNSLNMKKILALVMFVFAVYAGNAQEASKTSKNAAEITFEKDVHDYGTIDYGSDGNYAFKFTNTGNEPLIITDAKGSCGCTVPKFPKEPIMKGQSNYINVNYDTKRPGPFTKTVTVSSNGTTPSKVLTIKGVVKSQEQTEDITPVRQNSGMSPLENTSK